MELGNIIVVRRYKNMLKALTQEELNEVRRERDNRCVLEAMLREFIKMNVPCAEVENHEYANGGSGVSSIRVAIKRWHFDSLECFNVGDKIYLVNNNVTVK